MNPPSHARGTAGRRGARRAGQAAVMATAVFLAACLSPTALAGIEEGRQKARLNKNDIQCRFRGGGQLTLDLISLEGDRVVGRSENFGDIKLGLGALDSIKFNPWSRAADSGAEPGATGAQPADVDLLCATLRVGQGAGDAWLNEVCRDAVFTCSTQADYSSAS